MAWLLITANLLLNTPAHAASSAACPAILKSAGQSPAIPGQPLCQLYDRYHQAREKALAKGYKDPAAIADLLAPRLLARKDWQRERAKAHPDPRATYDPAPATWDNWRKALRASAAWAGGEGPKEIDLTHLQSLFRLATAHDRFPLGWRKGPLEIGRAWEKSEAMPAAEVEELEKISYPVVDAQRKILRGKWLLHWTETSCLEDRPAEFQKKFLADSDTYSQLTYWPPVKNSAFTDGSGVQRRCGYIRYLDSKLVLAQVKKWQEDINRTLGDWRKKEVPFDPFALAARAQRWLVAIHPFPAGNGRLSRFVMEEIIVQTGLPPPLLENMDADLGSAEIDWAKEIGQGVLRHIEILEGCAAEPKRKGCEEL